RIGGAERPLDTAQVAQVLEELHDPTEASGQRIRVRIHLRGHRVDIGRGTRPALVEPGQLLGPRLVVEWVLTQGTPGGGDPRVLPDGALTRVLDPAPGLAPQPLHPTDQGLLGAAVQLPAPLGYVDQAHWNGLGREVVTEHPTTPPVHGEIA